MRAIQPFGLAAAARLALNASTTPADAFLCSEGLKYWRVYCAGNVIRDIEEYEDCVIENMQEVGFRFPKDFVVDGPGNFYCR